MNSSDDDSNDGNSAHFSSANSVSDSKEEPPKVNTSFTFSSCTYSLDSSGIIDRILFKILKYLGSRTKRLKNSNYSNAERLQNKRKFSEVEGNTSDDSDVIYPRLHLTRTSFKFRIISLYKLGAYVLLYYLF